jgi:uncharacterized repeat protein (TIGR03803 family)
MQNLCNRCNRLRIRAIALAAGVLIAAALAPQAGAAGYQEKVLYRFFCTPRGECDDGATPAGLIMDKAGNLYGTAASGGTSTASYPSGAGVVFELTPNADRTAWVETRLHYFCERKNCTDGAVPNAGLVIDGAGNLYGTTLDGSPRAGGRGVVFELTPPADRVHGWTETVLYHFCTHGRCTDGRFPKAGLVMDPGGNIYGTTSTGGDNDDGVVFELTPNETGSAWTQTVLYNFCSAHPGCTDGTRPLASLIMDTAGDLYGTASDNGAYEGGTVFELVPNAARSAWTETVLYRFCPHHRRCYRGYGSDPRAALIMDASGSLYSFLGDQFGPCDPDCGVVFRLTPDAKRTAWTITAIDRLCAQGGEGPCPRGDDPSGLSMDAAGNFYGEASEGGSGPCSHGCGLVFALTPNQTRIGWTETVLRRFCPQKSDCPDGAAPAGGLVVDGAGNLYGATQYGGRNNGGVVFELEKLP